MSRNNLDKMLNEKAVGKSETPATHALAVANADILFRRAILGWSKPDSHGDPNIKAIHRFFAAMDTDNGQRIVKLTVKETVQASKANPLYTIEAVELDEESPAAKWVGEIADADGIDPRTIRSAGDVFNLAQAVQDGKWLFQKASTEDTKRGYLQIGADRRMTLGLTKDADLSTFLHETGHFYLEMLGDVAEMDGVSQEVKDDYAAILKWLGVASRGEIQTEHHEKFARANEAYLMEGKAPAPELQGAFARFREWLKLIYSKISLNVELRQTHATSTRATQPRVS